MSSTYAYQFTGWLSRSCPIPRVRWKIAHAVKRMKLSPARFVVRARDGRKFVFDSETQQGRRILFFGQVEPNITAVFSKLALPGTTVLDVGANVGWYSTLGSRLVGKSGSVIAVEGLPSTYRGLLESLSLNDCRNVNAVPALAGAAPGRAPVYEFPGLDSGASSMRGIAGQDAVVHDAEVVTLDGLIAKFGVHTVSVLKIDVEGAELDVLRGAVKALNTGVIQSVILEVNYERASAFGVTIEDLIRTLEASMPSNRLFVIKKGRLRWLRRLGSEMPKNGEYLCAISDRHPASSRF